MAAHPEPVNGADGRIKAALWFAEHGFGVFSVWSTDPGGTCRCPARTSCGVPGKHPITVNGFQDATTDAARIRTMLAAASRPNYGLVCPDGVFAWDVDGEGWRDRIASMEAQHGPLPPTLRTDTAHGQHVFLRWPDSLPRPLHKMFGWVTRWGTGKMAGYVIGPRSVHATGVEYTPTGTFEIATLPEAWAQAALAGEPTDPDVIRIGGEADPASIGVGHRHDYLRDRARFYAGSIRDPDALFAAVWALNEKLPQPKTQEDVRRAIGEALTRFPADPVDTQTDQVLEQGDPGMLPVDDDDSRFPAPPDAAAYEGIIGEVVEHLAQDTDASEVALLASVLAFCGVLMPSRGYLHGFHCSTPFLALVGPTGIGRKGTAMYKARDALGNVIALDLVNRVRLNGIASGEALVRALLDRARDGTTYANPVGVLFEEEYATYLAAAGREGSTLDSRMRAAFDGMSLAQRRAAETVVVPEPYWLSGLVGITHKELQAKVLQEAFYSGSGNRWLWLPVVRRDVTVENSGPPLLPRELADPLLEAHRAHMRVPPLLPVDAAVTRVLSEYDGFLREVTIGMAADMTRRLGVIAFRIALIHASVEQSGRVTVGHFRRGLALAEYSRRGLRWTFGDALGNKDATLLYRHLQEQVTLSNGTISKFIIKDIGRRQDAIDELQRAGVAEVIRVRTSGRTRSELRLVEASGGFRAFRATAAMDVTPILGAEGAEVRDDVARKERGRGAEGRGSPAEGASAGWIRPCRSYDRHQTGHRQVAAGWLCDTCEAESPSGICPVCGVGPFLSVEFFDRHQAQAHGR